MMALMYLWYVELEDRGKAARSSQITVRASAQEGKDEQIGGRCSSLRCLPRWASRERRGEFLRAKRAEKNRILRELYRGC